MASSDEEATIGVWTTGRPRKEADAVLQLFQTEWCLASHRVRERLTGLGVDYVVRQVPADKRKRHDLAAAAGTDTVPVLVTDNGKILEGEERVLAYLGEHYLEPRGAWMHRARAEKARRRYLEEECKCSPVTIR